MDSSDGAVLAFIIASVFSNAMLFFKLVEARDYNAKLEERLVRLMVERKTDELAQRHETPKRAALADAKGHINAALQAINKAVNNND